MFLFSKLWRIILVIVCWGLGILGVWWCVFDGGVLVEVGLGGIKDWLSGLMVVVVFGVGVVVFLVGWVVSVGRGFGKEVLFILFISLLASGLSVVSVSVVGFYILFEMSVVPLLFLIWRFGKTYDRFKAAKMIVGWTVFWGLVFWSVISSVWWGVSEFCLLNIYGMGLCLVSGSWGLIGYGLVFSLFFVKLSVFGYHLWLPEAHVEAPSSASVLLGGVLLKLGAYGVIRFSLGVDFSGISGYQTVLWGFLGLLVFGVFVISYVTLFVFNWKKWVAFISVFHMSLGLCLWVLNYGVGYEGFVIQLVVHSFSCSSAFSLCEVVRLSSGSYGPESLSGQAGLVKGGQLSLLGVLFFGCGLIPFLGFFVEVLQGVCGVGFSLLFLVGVHFSFLVVLYSGIRWYQGGGWGGSFFRVKGGVVWGWLSIWVCFFIGLLFTVYWDLVVLFSYCG
uniref:NADH-ubiquinone oxidoreductase chain 4 n=1 Tax=Cephalodiscus hodgsoni TaxID=560606 RepID=A0A481P8D3_9BILA|nr:NADH dehydrogenase subunit 4 [Cephalodiscus hodgsoni]